MKNKILKNIVIYVIIFVVMLFAFCAGMVITYALPNDRIQAHIAESKEIGLTPTGIPTVKGAQIDEFTDLLILNTAMNKGKEENEGLFVRAFENSRYSLKNDDQAGALAATIEDAGLYNNQEYTRYWHGIQTIMRPLLLFLNYQEIRYLFMFVMFMLFMLTVISIYKNFNLLHAMAFVLAMSAVCFFIVPMSVQFINVFAIAFIGVILVNVLYRLKKQNLYPYLFFIMGGLVVFFDLLTAPLLTLGIPLIYVVLLKHREKIEMKKILWEIIKLSALWCIAYGTLFFSKWVIASIVLHKDVITAAFNQILYRANGNELYPATRWGAVSKNIKYLYNVPLFVILVGITITWMAMMVKNRKPIKDCKIAILLILVALYPYVWYCVCAGHSDMHPWFTYRVQAISILSILCAMIETIDSSKSRNRGKFTWKK